jgi:preprotein translocase subunit SecA
MNYQRALIYEQRKRVLLGEDLRNTVFAQMAEFVEARTKEYASPEVHPDDWNREALHQALAEVYPVGVTVEQMAEFGRHEELVEFLQADIASAYEEREGRAGGEQMRELEQLVALRVVSARWIDHLAAMEELEEGIGLRGYSGVDPLILYRKESYDYWQRLLETIREDIIRFLFRVEIRPQETEEQRRARLGLGQTPQGEPVEMGEDDAMAAAAGVVESRAASKSRTAIKAPPSGEAPRRMAQRGRKVGRNDPCPCGSGRKYKKCCGRGSG